MLLHKPEVPFWGAPLVFGKPPALVTPYPHADPARVWVLAIQESSALEMYYFRH